MALHEKGHDMNIVAVTGRRIDAPDSQIARFPLAQAPAVKASIRNVLSEIGAQAVVSSAACGADLLALAAADGLGIPAHIVLPLGRETFRATSVVDRPGNWGPLFDQLVDSAQEQGRLHLTESSGSNHDAYLDAVIHILDKAAELSRQTNNGHEAESPGSITALVIWDGEPRGPDDITAYFLTEARKRGFALREVRTRDSGAPAAR